MAAGPRDELRQSPFFQGALAKLLIEYPRGYACLLAYMEGMTQDAIAERLKISRTSVRKRLARAKMLMKLYVTEGIEGENYG